MFSRAVKSSIALVLAALMSLGGAFAANAAGGTVGITQSVKLAGGASGQSVEIPSGGSFVWAVNFTCSIDDCHGGMVRLNFPSTLVAGVANYSVSEVSRVIRSSTQVTFVLNQSIAVGTTSQLTLSMSAPGWTTPDGTVASLTSNFTTSDGENVTTTAATATIQSSNTTTVNSTKLSGGRIGGATTVAVTFCAVAPGGTTEGPVGIDANSVVVATVPAGFILQSSDGGVYNSTTNKITWVVASQVTGCITYSITAIFAMGTFNDGDLATYDFIWTGKDIGSVATARTLGTSTTVVTLDNPAASGSTTSRTSSPELMWVGGTGSIDITMINPNDSSQALDSVEISETVPEGLGLGSITVRNSSGGPAAVYIKSAWGADGIQGNADDAAEYLAKDGIAASGSATIDVTQTLPSGSPAITNGNYVTYFRVTYGSIAPNSGPLDLLSYGWTMLATTRSGAAVVAGDLFPGTANVTYTETVPGFAQTTVPATASSTTEVINQPPPPAPFLTTRNGLGFNMSANLLPGVRSVPMGGSFASFGNTLAKPVLLLIQPPSTKIVDSSMVVKNGGTTLTEFTMTRVENFTYNLGQGSKTGELVKITFPDDVSIANNTSMSVEYTLNLEDTLMGNPRVYSAFSSRSNNSYGTETQWWGTWCDTAADLDGDGIAGNGACTVGDVRNFPLFFTDLIPAVSVSASLTQLVKGSWDPAFVAGPSKGYTTPGATDGFRISLRNRGTVPLDAATVVTIMPRPGDTNVLSATARNSATATFPVLLKTAPVLPAGLTGVTVSYSTVDGICRTELGYSPAGCASPNWSTTAPADLADVTALLFEFGANVLNPGITWNIDMTVTTPATGATEPDFAIVNPLVNDPATDEKAKSSSAYVIREFGQASMLNAAESPAVTLQMPGPFGPAGVAPTAPDKDSTGVGTASQEITVVAPASGSVALLNNSGVISTDFVVPGQGRYTFTNGKIVFLPELGFVGTADPVLYQVTDVFGQTGIATYTASVTAPGAPTAVTGGTTNEEEKGQTFTPTLPEGGSIVLRDENGLDVTSLTVIGVGTYTVVGNKIEFVPVVGYVGSASLNFLVFDAYGQSAAGTYNVVVTAKAPVVPEEEEPEEEVVVPEEELAETGAAFSPSIYLGVLLILSGLLVALRRKSQN